MTAKPRIWRTYRKLETKRTCGFANTVYSAALTHNPLVPCSTHGGGTIPFPLPASAYTNNANAELACSLPFGVQPAASLKPGFGAI